MIVAPRRAPESRGLEMFSSGNTRDAWTVATGGRTLLGFP
jgi:hypothetical protein